MTPEERSALIIRQAIDKSGLTAAEVARRANISRSILCRIARGAHEPKMSTVLRVIEACGLEFIEIRVRKSGATNSNVLQISSQDKPKP